MSPADLAALAAAFDLTDGDIAVAAEKIASQVQRMAAIWKTSAPPNPWRGST